MPMHRKSIVALTWLLIVALPVQAMAANVMIDCGPQHGWPTQTIPGQRIITTRIAFRIRTGPEALRQPVRRMHMPVLPMPEQRT